MECKLFKQFKTGDRISVTIYDSGEIHGNITMISANKEDIIIDNIEYISNCYPGQQWVREPVMHINAEEVCQVKLIA